MDENDKSHANYAVLPNNGTNSKIHIVVSVKSGNGREEDDSSRGSEGDKGSSGSVFLHLQLTTQNFKRRSEEVTAQLIFMTQSNGERTICIHTIPNM